MDPRRRLIPRPTAIRRRRAAGLLGAAALAAAAAAAAQADPPPKAGGREAPVAFDWSPGRMYPVRTAPLRLTTLTLEPGETVIAVAAGDTVRWKIGEASSGEDPRRQAHVLIKPLAAGLATNLVLATSRRVYLISLTSGPVDRYHPLVTWRTPPEPLKAASPAATEGLTTTATGLEVPDLARLETRYRIQVRGPRPAWTPRLAATDGRRTYIDLPDALPAGRSPALFARGPDGRLQTIAYRQAGTVLVTDRVLDRAVLRLGLGRGEVRLERLAPGARP
jgi:type IV secretion system protein VirB9